MGELVIILIGSTLLAGLPPSSADVIPADPIQSHAADTLVAATGQDSIFRVRFGDGDYRLVWITPRWSHVVESRTAGLSSVTLVNINGDSLPDLFTTIDYEGLVGGQVLLGGATTPSLAYESGSDPCRPPELIDVTGDGVAEIIEHEPSAFAVERCSGDPYASMCMADYLTEWVNVLQLAGDSYVPAGGDAAPYYRLMAHGYERDADRLDEALRSGTAPGPDCDAAVVEALREMSVRAREIATR